MLPIGSLYNYVSVFTSYGSEYAEHFFFYKMTVVI